MSDTRIQLSPRIWNSSSNPPTSNNSITGDSLIPLEDCKCPICLDYFIDVVETRCHHRFCNFCLENWLRVGVHRQCPTCRSVILGPLQVKPDLQESIDSSISVVLSEEAVRERLQIRSERQTQVTRFSADREQTQALLATINSSRTRLRQARRSRRLADVDNPTRESRADTYLPRRLFGWVDDNNNNGNGTTATVTEVSPEEAAARLAEVIRLEEQIEANFMDLGWVRRVRDLHLEEHLENLSAAQEPVNLPPHSSRNITVQVSSTLPRESQRSRATSQFDQSYHENLMEEYNYHLRRVNSAHTRIREAYRDFNYHNGRMQEILQEHRSFFSSNNRESNNVGPLDAGGNSMSNITSYEDIIGLEMGELLDNSPAAQVVFSGFTTENPVESNQLSQQNFPPEIRPFTFGREINNENDYTRRRRSAPVPLPYRTNVLDMEQEIRNRRDQLGRLTSLIRDRATGLSQLTQPQLNTWARRCSGQHQIMGESLTGVSSNSTPAPPYSARRMRRRFARTNLSRANENTDRVNTAIASNEQPPSAHNSFSENILSPTMDLSREASNTNANTGASNVTNLQPNISPTNRMMPSSVGWIAESTDSEEDEPTTSETTVLTSTRACNRLSQNSTQRATTAVPPARRNFRRAIRFHRRQSNSLPPNENNSGNTVTTGPASSSSNTNTSTTATRNADSITNALMNSDEEALVVEILQVGAPNASDDDMLGRTENEQSPNVESHASAEAENDESIYNAMREMASVNTYLRNMCDQFKA